MTDPDSNALPTWDLTPLYESLEGPAIETALTGLAETLDALETWTTDSFAPTDREDEEDGAARLEAVIPRLNDVILVCGRLGTYAHCQLSTNSRDPAARKRVSEIEQLELGLGRILRRLDQWLSDHSADLESWCGSVPDLAEYRQILRDRVCNQRWRMPLDQEDLAADLLVSGGSAMWKLQNTMTTQQTVSVEQDGVPKTLPMSMVRSLAYDPDEHVRQSAYQAELKGWAAIREPVAFALNGVKGSALSLARRRGHPDVLSAALHANRMDRETLDALLSAMQNRLPTFQSYLQSKARKLGKTRLPWWDLFAPVGRHNPRYTWPESESFVIEQFGQFHDELAAFASDAFARRWIDAEPREGKTGGGFCAPVPALDESRILINFDGSLDQIATLAHELGHAFHNHCQSGLPALLRGAPSTLAETASTFCETIVFDAALAAAPSPETTLSILENQLMGATQVIVDIYSRYRFESEFFRHRAQAEVNAEDCCEMMLAAQREAYGDGLDPDFLHPYMWVLKPHYYSVDGAFYNFPYAFGLLFGLGIYSVYRAEPDGFLDRYRTLLRGTGQGWVADQAGRFGIDVRTPAFWDSALAILADRVDQYIRLDG